MAWCHQAKIKVTVWHQQANISWDMAAWWCIYVLFVNGDIIGLDDGLLPVQYQAITWKIAGLQSTGLDGTNFSQTLIKCKHFISIKCIRKVCSVCWVFCSGFNVLTHLPLNKMAAILADGIFKSIFLNENDRISIQISLTFVPRSPINNKAALVQVMALCRTGEKP